MEALEQRVVEIARDPGPFVDPGVQRISNSWWSCRTLSWYPAHSTSSPPLTHRARNQFVW